MQQKLILVNSELKPVNNWFAVDRQKLKKMLIKYGLSGSQVTAASVLQSKATSLIYESSVNADL